MQTDIRYVIATTDQEFEKARELILEYANSLGIDLSFQNFSSELETIKAQYNKPNGGLLLAFMGKIAAGCVGIRRLDKETAELKRMYVRPAYRGHQIGKRLVELAIDMARELGYHTIRLDTLPDMTKAQTLYRSFGFTPIPSYRYNPMEGTVYMEKALF